MQVAHPLDRAYHFEITARSNRLVYYIPPTKLRAEVRKQILHSNILKDYPHGVEVDVNAQDYSYLENLYRFAPPMPADVVWWAFLGLMDNIGPQLHHLVTGWINAALLENYAKSLYPFVEEWLANTAKAGSSQTGETQDRDESTPRSRPFLLSHPPEGVNLEIPWNEQTWGKVRMSAGLQAFEMFNRIQQPKRSKKRGNRG
jgi:hypothetical protein